LTFVASDPIRTYRIAIAFSNYLFGISVDPSLIPDPVSVQSIFFSLDGYGK